LRHRIERGPLGEASKNGVCELGSGLRPQEVMAVAERKAANTDARGNERRPTRQCFEHLERGAGASLHRIHVNGGASKVGRHARDSSCHLDVRTGQCRDFGRRVSAAEDEPGRALDPPDTRQDLAC
jgi:hypothetical protein